MHPLTYPFCLCSSSDTLRSTNSKIQKATDMCQQKTTRHDRCGHETRYKPHFCRYRWNISHQIEKCPSTTNTMCKSCLEGRTIPLLDPQAVEVTCAGQKENGSRRGTFEKNGDEEGESEWKRKLRDKLRKGKGNEEILKGSLLGKLDPEESST